MRIDRLYVESFRHFASSEWTFAPHFNVLIGDNGTGKSSVLQALRIAVGSFLLGIDGVSAQSITNEDIRYDIVPLQDQRAVRRPQFPVRVEATGVVGQTQLTWVRERHGENRNTNYGGAKELNKIAADLQKRSRKGDLLVVFPVIAYYGPGRLYRQLQDRSSRPITPKETTYGYQSALAAESDFDFQMSWWRMRALSNRGRLTGIGYLDAIYNTILAVLGDGWNRLEYDFDLADIIVRNPEDTWHPVKSLSDGQRTILAMALDLAYRCVTLNPGLEGDAVSSTPGVVLIDEIDLHLHPRWQRTIVENLRKAFPRVQFISTTHSPLIIQSLRPGELIDLNGGNPRDYFKQSVEEILTDEMGLTDVRRNHQYQEMMRVADEYYRLLEEKRGVDDNLSRHLQSRLDELTLPFHENPAYSAYRNFLEQRKLVALGNGS